MTKVLKHIIFQIAILLCAFSSSYCSSIEGIWIPEKIHWQSPNIEELKETKYASISILQFLDGGTFKIFDFTVYLQGDGSINISIPEWGNIFIGKWKTKNNNEIIVNYRLVDRMIETSSQVDGRWEKEPLPGKKIKKSILLDTIDKDNIKVNFDKENFVRNDKLTKDSVEFISKYKSKY
jgi:hypothetical protein